MLLMLIERFADQDAIAVYTHLRDKGRGLPDGLKYIAVAGRCRSKGVAVRKMAVFGNGGMSEMCGHLGVPRRP
jgi:hypothetical protein